MFGSAAVVGILQRDIKKARVPTQVIASTSYYTVLPVRHSGDELASVRVFVMVVLGGGGAFVLLS